MEKDGFDVEDYDKYTEIKKNGNESIIILKFPEGSIDSNDESELDRFIDDLKKEFHDEM